MRTCLIFRDILSGGTSVEEIFKGLLVEFTKTQSITAFFYSSRISLYRSIIALRRVKCDVYHITGGVHHLVYFLMGRKVILTIHDLGRFKELKGIRKFIYRELYLRGPMLLASKITVVSKTTAQDLQEHFSSRINKKISVIYNPIPLKFEKNVQPFNATKPAILQVGTAVNKNLNSVINALDGLACKLIIIGRLTVEDRMRLQNSHIDYKNYHALSYDDVYTQYCNSDIVVFLSTHEGFGMPVIEGQATGRVVMASNCSAIPEIGGMGVHYVENPKDTQEIRAGLIKIIYNNHYREDLIAKGFQNIKRFEYHLIANAYIKIYAAVQTN